MKRTSLRQSLLANGYFVEAQNRVCRKVKLEDVKGTLAVEPVLRYYSLRNDKEIQDGMAIWEVCQFYYLPCPI